MTAESPPSHAARTSPANFDRVARLYRWAEYLLLGHLLTRTREHFLPLLTNANHALVLGDGDGRFLAQLLRRAPNLRVVAVDTSAAMLHLLRQRCAFAAPRLQTLQTSATELPADLNLGKTDLIVTHFFLDCLHQQDLDTLVHNLARRVAPGCLWVLSDFAIPQRQPWRTLGLVYIQALYLAFRLLTGLRPQRLPDIHNAFQTAGFVKIYRSTRLAGLLYSELRRLDLPPAHEDDAQLAARSRSST